MPDPRNPERSTTAEERALIKCPTCGVPWDEHTDACSRHDFRPGAEVPSNGHADRPTFRDWLRSFAPTTRKD